MRRTITYRHRIGRDAWMRVRLTTVDGVLTSYAVVLAALDGPTPRTIRVFDNAHGRNEMHRYTRSGGKERGETFHHGHPSEAAQAALLAVSEGWEEMVSAWYV